MDKAVELNKDFQQKEDILKKLLDFFIEKVKDIEDKDKL